MTKTRSYVKNYYTFSVKTNQKTRKRRKITEQITKCIECKKDFWVDVLSLGVIVFCDNCVKNQCRRCYVVLNKNLGCKCNKRHGNYDLGSKFCRDCSKIR